MLQIATLYSEIDYDGIKKTHRSNIFEVETLSI